MAYPFFFGWHSEPDNENFALQRYGNLFAVMVEFSDTVLKGGGYERARFSGSLFRLRLTLVLLQYGSY